jgi:beta-lactamase regulating signal transducer with metallopeptidase domain
MTTLNHAFFHGAANSAFAALIAQKTGTGWLETLLPAHIVHPLGWALLHFLWQGLLIGLLAAGALALLRRRSANACYLAGCVALLLMAMAPVATFAWLYQPPRPTAASAARVLELPSLDQAAPAPREPLTTASPALADLPSVAPPPVPWHIAAREWCEARLFSFVSLWLAGVLALTGWLLAGWVQVRRWRLITSLAPQWRDILAELAERLRLRRVVRVLESHLADVPMTLGWLRPVILVPACALTGLTPEQLRALLAHELAHVKRYDYLVNLVQSLVETLLFYHPAVWWISWRVRAEREHCCDDLAVRACESPATYVGALASAAALGRERLAEARCAPGLRGSRLAVAATGGALLDRARRVLGVSAPQRHQSAQWLAGALVLGATVTMGAGLHVASAQLTSAERKSRDEPTASQPAATEREELARAIEREQLRYNRLRVELRVQDRQIPADGEPEPGRKQLYTVTAASDMQRGVGYVCFKKSTEEGTRIELEAAWDGRVGTELAPAGPNDPNLAGRITRERHRFLLNGTHARAFMHWAIDNRDLAWVIRNAREFQSRAVERDGRSLRELELTTVTDDRLDMKDAAPPHFRISRWRVLVDPQRNWLPVEAEVKKTSGSDPNAPAPERDVDAIKCEYQDFREIAPGVWAPHRIIAGMASATVEAEVQSIAVGPAVEIPERVQFPPGTPVKDETEAETQPSTPASRPAAGTAALAQDRADPGRAQTLSLLSEVRRNALKSAASASGVADFSEKDPQGAGEFQSSVAFAYSGERVIVRHSDTSGLAAAYLAEKDREAFYFPGRSPAGPPRSVRIAKPNEPSFFLLPSRSAFTFAQFTALPVPVPEQQFFARVGRSEQAKVETRDGRWVTITTQDGPEGADHPKETGELVFDLQLGGMLVSASAEVIQKAPDGRQDEMRSRWELSWRAQGETIVPLSRKIEMQRRLGGTVNQTLEQRVDVKEFVPREVAPEELSYGALQVPPGTPIVDQISNVEYRSSDKNDLDILKDSVRKEGWAAPQPSPAVQPPASRPGVATSQPKAVSGTGLLSGVVLDATPADIRADVDRLTHASSDDEARRIFAALSKALRPPPTPQADAVVTVRGESLVREVRTDTEGRFVCWGLPEGTYEVSAVAPARPSESGTMLTPAGRASVTLSFGMKHVVLRLRADSVTVSGRVTDEHGRPVPGARVTGIQEIDASQSEETSPVFFAATRDDGTYQFTGLPPPDIHELAGYLNGGRPGPTSMYFLVRVEAPNLRQTRENTPRFLLVTSDLLDAARRYLGVMKQLELRLGGESDCGEKADRGPFPTSRGNTITGIDVVLAS